MKLINFSIFKNILQLIKLFNVDIIFNKISLRSVIGILHENKKIKCKQLLFLIFVKVGTFNL